MKMCGSWEWNGLDTSAHNEIESDQARQDDKDRDDLPHRFLLIRSKKGNVGLMHIDFKIRARHWANLQSVLEQVGERG